MIKIFKTPHCPYCQQTARYLDYKKVPYEMLAAEGAEYLKLTERFGVTAPLVYNPANNKGMVGYNISKLKELIGGK